MYPTTQGDLPLSHITILSVFFQFDLNSIDLDLGQGHLNTFLSFSSKGSIITPNLKAFGAILTELGQIYWFLVNFVVGCHGNQLSLQALQTFLSEHLVF